MFRLDEKLSRIREGRYGRGDFVIADAKDGDMGPALAATGILRDAKGQPVRPRTREEFLDQIEAVVKQDAIDVMLVSASNLERLQARGAFEGSRVKPAIRANDTTDIWVFRGASYAEHPSRPFRTASLPRVMHGGARPDPDAPVTGTDLGLYSITFNADLDADQASLEAFAAFRADAQANGFRYFLEVFNPNAPSGLDPETMPRFVNDAILRSLAGLVAAERPEFLKIAYNGPEALEEMTSFDPSLIVGVLGGGAGTTRDCLELIAQAERFGARVALFGRKINLADDPLSMVRMMRAVADGDVAPEEAVRAYHGALSSGGIVPSRDLEEDVRITEAVLQRAAA